MSIREFLVDITTASGAGKVNVFYADAEQPADLQMAALRAFYTSYRTWVPSFVSFQPRSIQRILDEATGVLTGESLEPGGALIVGSAGGTSAADATQVLMRWNTGVVVGGRFLKGRTFLPGLTTAQITGGNLSTNVITAMTTAGNTLSTTAADFGVWHRPKDGAGGSFHQWNGATVWSELAVLRRRRG